MRWWLPAALFAFAIWLAVALFVLGDRDGADASGLAGSVDSATSVIICTDGQVQQHVVDSAEVRRLFADVSCPDLFRWQLDADFERLLTVETVGEGRHIYVTDLDGSSFDLTSLMGFESTFDSRVEHRHPRFDVAGRVLLLDGGDLLVVDPSSGDHERITLPPAFDEARWNAGSQCDGDPALVQLSVQLATMCPWGWFEPTAPSEPSFFIRRSDPPVLVARAPVPPQIVEVELVGEFGVCGGADPRFYWVDGTLVCVGTGLGTVQYELDGGAFTVSPALVDPERRPENVIVDLSGDQMYFTTDRADGIAGTALWQLPTAGGAPQLVTTLTPGDFTLLGAR